MYVSPLSLYNITPADFLIPIHLNLFLNCPLLPSLSLFHIICNLHITFKEPMTTYNLEDNPNLFIAPKFHHDKLVYRLFLYSGEEDEVLTGVIDLRSDRLMVYGTEIGESVVEKLHQSLILEPGTGAVRVNCYGACYFVLPGRVRYRSVHNVIFDWSQFGVIVPNSFADSLKKKLEQKEKEFKEMKNDLSSAKAEAVLVKEELEVSKKEVEELKKQVSTCKRNDQNVEMDPQKLQAQPLLDKTQLEFLNKIVKEFEDQLAFYRKDSQAKEVEKQKLQDELCAVNIELRSSKTQLVSLKEREKELEEKLSDSKKESEEKRAELQKVIHELQSTESQLRSSVKILQELKDDFFTWKKENVPHREEELLKASHHLLSIDSELKATRQKLEEVMSELKCCHQPEFRVEIEEDVPVM